jgi:hypothetical protein
MSINFDPKQHDYTRHQTYSGQGCAMCGREIADHWQGQPVDAISRYAPGKLLRIHPDAYRLLDDRPGGRNQSGDSGSEFLKAIGL